MIAGAGLKRQKRRLPYSAESSSVQIIEPHKMPRLAQWPDDDVVLSRRRARKQLRHRVFNLGKRLLGPEAVSSVMLPHPSLKSGFIILGSSARIGIQPFIKLVLQCIEIPPRTFIANADNRSL
jgi:hypothetical protein